MANGQGSRKIQKSHHVIASGESHSVREFLDIAYNHIGLDYHQYLVTDPQLYSLPKSIS